VITEGPETGVATSGSRTTATRRPADTADRMTVDLEAAIDLRITSLSARSGTLD
jgi:hypothetical protein